MIRVLHAVPFGGGLQGGIESLVMNIYRNIDKDKIQFDFITYGDPSDYVEEIERLGGHVYCLTSRKKNIFKYYGETLRFFKVYGRRYSYLHLHLCSASNILPLKVNKTIPNVIVHSHLSATIGRIASILQNLNKGYLLYHSTFLFACSDLAGTHLFGNHCTSDSRYRFIPNGVDINRFKYSEERRKKIRKQYHFTEDDIILGFTGRLAREKNIPFLVDIVAHLVHLSRNYKLILVGEGEMRPFLEEQIRELSLSEHVFLLGECSNVSEILQGMDIFVTASKAEGLPVSLIEAQAAGLECVISSAITKQANICGQVHYMDKEASSDEWAVNIFKLKLPERSSNYKKIYNSPFNIISVAHELQNFYLTHVV